MELRVPSASDNTHAARSPATCADTINLDVVGQRTRHNYQMYLTTECACHEQVQDSTVEAIRTAWKQTTAQYTAW